jgi:hypothetical protein
VHAREDPQAFFGRAVVGGRAEVEVVDLAVAWFDEDADAVRVGSLFAVGGGVADGDAFGAEGAGDHRGRATAVEVDRGFDAFFG